MQQRLWSSGFIYPLILEEICLILAWLYLGYLLLYLALCLWLWLFLSEFTIRRLLPKGRTYTQKINYLIRRRRSLTMIRPLTLGLLMVDSTWITYISLKWLQWPDGEGVLRVFVWSRRYTEAHLGSMIRSHSFQKAIKKDVGMILTFLSFRASITSQRVDNNENGIFVKLLETH